MMLVALITCTCFFSEVSRSVYNAVRTLKRGKQHDPEEYSWRLYCAAFAPLGI